MITKQSLTYRIQVQRRKCLIRRLFWNIVKEIFKGKNYLDFITLKLINSNIEYSSCKLYFDGQIIITININEYRLVNRIGYSDYYYKGRNKLTSKYIKYNRHNSIRFAIYHELGHALDCKQFESYSQLSLKNKEYSADCFALKHLKPSKSEDWNK